MSIKDILIYLDDSSACERRIEAALTLAQKLGARVSGLTIATYEFYQPHYLHADEKKAAVGALLETKALAAGVEASYHNIESSVMGVTVQELLIRASHCSDLLVVGQELRRTARSSAVLEHLVTGAGRPVIVIPDAGTFPKVGSRVLVAWRNGREAARALHDAIPILRQAELVTLLMVTSEETASMSQWEEVREHLHRHGIQAGSELKPVTSATLADGLLNHACEGGYDLLVMGAYSPKTRRGSKFGEVAWQILREMTIPVLISH